MRYEEREFITMYQIDYTNVGKRMKTLRKQAGYTQEQIADALDVTVAFISNIENDRVKMNLRVLSYYAKLLNVSIDYLLRPESDENGDEEAKTVATPVKVIVLSLAACVGAGIFYVLIIDKK